MENKFIHLHLHTEYSLLKGVGKIKNIIAKAKEMGMDSIAITDDSVMYGCVDFYKEAKRVGIKPILGCEVDIIFRGNPYWKWIFLVKNSFGYSNLMKIVSFSAEKREQLLTNKKELKKYKEGLIVIFSCYTDKLMNDLYNSKSDTKKMILNLKEVFGEDLYIEIQNHYIDIEIPISSLVREISIELDIQLVATNNVHYVERNDIDAYEILLCMQQGTILDKVNRKKYKNSEYYLKSSDEMCKLFSDMPIAIENTQVIASKCDFNYDFHISRIPKYPIETGIDEYDYLEKLCVNGLNTYLRDEDILKNTHKVSLYFKRLKYELSVINSMKYVDYFLIVMDFIEYAKKKRIPTGPGRGSGAGSLVAFVLGITKIDPLKYGLVFERFLNPERISMPDIDCDFCYRRRQEVIDYVICKYGREKVAQIITFGTFAAKTIIRDFGKALNIPTYKIEKINKLIPVIQGKSLTIGEAEKEVEKLNKLKEEDLSIRKLLELCKKVEGNARHISTHAAGVVIAAEALENIIPIQEHEGIVLTQFGMTTLEEHGLLKIDFLGLKTLTVLDDTVNLIKENHQIYIDLDKIDYNDVEVFNMLGEGNTAGVFQLESEGMTSFIRNLKPNCLEDIIAGISLYRPGPMAEIPKYIQNKKNKDKIEYLTPALKPILEVTYGCLIYQEQVMEIVRQLGGYSMGRSDLVRRAMSKKKYNIMEEERKTFLYGKTEDKVLTVPGCIRNGIDEDTGNKIFDIMIEFASYAFNKSHAVSYAVLAFQTAYLIRYYPAEYMTAKLNSVSDNSEKVLFYINNAQKINLAISGPEINSSSNRVLCSNNNIVLGLEMIKHVGKNVARHIIECREQNGKFLSFEDFLKRVDLKIVGKNIIENLIKSGAMDIFGVYRSQLLSVYEREYDNIFCGNRNELFGQMTLFDYNGEYKIIYPEIDEYELGEILKMEKETLGFYVSGNRIAEYLKGNNSKVLQNIKDVSHEYNNSNNFSIVGIITHISRIKTKNNKEMLFLKLEDGSGSIEVIVFPKILSKYESQVCNNQIVLIEGRLSKECDKEEKMICQRIEVLSKEQSVKIYIRIEDTQQVDKVKKVFSEQLKEYCCGKTPVYVYIDRENQVYQLNKDWWITFNKTVQYQLEKYFGKSNVQIK